MSSSTKIQCTVDGKSTEHKRVRQGRPQTFESPYGQRLFLGDSERIAKLGLERNDLVRLATHKFLNELENSVYTELVKT